MKRLMYNQNRNLDGTFAYCEKLTERQRAMIIELISNGGNKTQACKTLNIPRTTLYDWLDQECFMTAYRKSVERIYQDGLSDALKTIVKLMKSADARTALKAAEDLMKLNGYLDAKTDPSEKPQEIKISLVNPEEEAQ